MADALHSVTDSANNVLGLITNQFSSPLPDREHPYGHQKFQAVGALGIAAFLAIACFEILQGAVERIINGSKPVTISAPQLWLLLLVSGCAKLFVSLLIRGEVISKCCEARSVPEGHMLRFTSLHSQ